MELFSLLKDTIILISATFTIFISMIEIRKIVKRWFKEKKAGFLKKNARTYKYDTQDRNLFFTPIT